MNNNSDGSLNLRDFYSNQKKEEVRAWENLGFNVRTSFQHYSSGREGEEDVFVVKSQGRGDCFGIELFGSVSYILPVSHSEVILFIFDENLKQLVDAFSSFDDARFKVYSKHIPIMINAIRNAGKGDYHEYCMFSDDDMICFAKKIYYPLFDYLEEGYVLEPDLIQKIVDLVNFRNACVDEAVSFGGFSKQEEAEILLLKGADFVYEMAREVSAKAIFG